MCGASSTIRLAQSILRRKFPSVDKPLRIPAPPKISPSKTAFEKYKPRGLIIFRILRYVSLKSARLFRLNSALIVDCLRFFFLAPALSKVFRKASSSLMKEQSSRLSKSAASNIFSYFVSFRATRVKDWSRVRDGKIGYCNIQDISSGVTVLTRIWNT